MRIEASRGGPWGALVLVALGVGIVLVVLRDEKDASGETSGARTELQEELAASGAQNLDLADAADLVSSLIETGDLVPEPGETQEVLTEQLALVDAEHWEEERIVNTLTAGPLADLRTLLLGPRGVSFTPPPLADVFTADARVGPLEPPGFEETQVTSGIVRREWTGLEEASGSVASPPAWGAALARLHAGTKRVRWALVKPTRIELTSSGARIEIAWSLNRELAGGALRHDQGRWASEWVRADEERWRCRSLLPMEGGFSLLASAPHFVDATLEAFAGTFLDPRRPAAESSGRQRGVVLADLDQDGDLDLVVTVTNRVLYNRGDGTFEDRTLKVMGETSRDAATRGGALVADHTGHLHA